MKYFNELLDSSPLTNTKVNIIERSIITESQGKNRCIVKSGYSSVFDRKANINGTQCVLRSYYNKMKCSNNRSKRIKFIRVEITLIEERNRSNKNTLDMLAVCNRRLNHFISVSFSILRIEDTFNPVLPFLSGGNLCLLSMNSFCSKHHFNDVSLRTCSFRNYVNKGIIQPDNVIFRSRLISEYDLLIR